MLNSFIPKLLATTKSSLHRRTNRKYATWIAQQKESFILPKGSNRDIDINTFNEAQEVSYKIVFDHFMQEDDTPLLLIITGLAGSGKSHVIDAMKNLLKEKCKVCAYFGIAAFNVKGQTLHSLFQLPIKGKRSTDLKGQALTMICLELDM